MANDEVGIAHRTLPCGTRVLLGNPRTGRWVVATVVDHGPYGARLDDGSWAIKRRRTDPGVWRGCLDISRRTAELLGHDGFQKIFYVPMAQW